MIRKRDVAHGLQYAQDLFKLATHRFEHPSSLFKFRVLDRLRERTGAKLMIESGTFEGDTSRRCARVFERVVTIELDPSLAQKAKRALTAFPNIEVLQGDATLLVPEVLKRPDTRDAVVFLDGHVSGGVTACGDIPEPACHELVAMEPYREKIRGVVIDDFRCFGVEAGFPSKVALLTAVEEFCGKRFSYSVEHDQVVIALRSDA